jgi:hypothetical protein
VQALVAGHTYDFDTFPLAVVDGLNAEIIDMGRNCDRRISARTRASGTPKDRACPVTLSVFATPKSSRSRLLMTGA